jgi:DNA-directed RNA polymerase specialized sigma subunit
MLDLIQGQYDLDFIKSELDGSCIEEEINEFLHYIIEDGLVLRNRAVIVLAYLKKISKIEIAQFLGIS